MIKAEIQIPLLNANEPEARVVRIHVKDGEFVEKGALVCTIETTKAVSEIESPETGYIHLLAKEGDNISVGNQLALITENIHDPERISKQDTPANEHSATLPLSSLRITKPARALAESLNLDLSTLLVDRLVTEELVKNISATLDSPMIELPPSEKPYILIYGAGGHAKSVIEMVRLNNVQTIAGIVDDDISLLGKKVLGIPVLGTRVVLPKLKHLGVKNSANGVGGIIDISIRRRIFEILEQLGFSFPFIIHPRAMVEASAKIDEGVQVFANAYVGADSVLKSKCMVNTNSIVSHDCEIGSFTHIAPGVMLAGHVQIGEQTLVGMGVTTTIGVRIGSRVRIGNGAIILADIPDKMVIKAGQLWMG